MGTWLLRREITTARGMKCRGDNVHIYAKWMKH
jgi:hypothetical protein